MMVEMENGRNGRGKETSSSVGVDNNTALLPVSFPVNCRPVSTDRRRRRLRHSDKLWKSVSNGPFIRQSVGPFVRLFLISLAHSIQICTSAKVPFIPSRPKRRKTREKSRAFTLTPRRGKRQGKYASKIV